MKILIYAAILVQLIISPAFATNKPEVSVLVLIGSIPAQYLANQGKHKYIFGFIEIENRVIQKMGPLKPSELADFEKKNKDKKIVKLINNNSKDYDVIYPGMINLHNHTKQNNLPVWSEARGQFANRFEWRDWPNYKYAVSGNMNPWVDYARAVECATYRWSELQAMVWGTTYLQGPSSCVDNFAILRVEDASSYISSKANVQAPTDLVIPQDMEFVWNTLAPIIRQGETYEAALAQTIKKHCPSIAVTAQNINSTQILKILKDQAKLVELCQKENLPDKFIRYVYWIHPTIAGRKNYFQNKKTPPSALIAHLAEGRRDDVYNTKEYEIIKLLGLDLPKVNFVHGVGISKEQFQEMATKDMGLIWSPFSNLVLYNQTLDVASAFKAGVNIALGSDWVPTGTKSVLEEVKVARNYILKDPEKENLVSTLTHGSGKLEDLDEQLYKMITENPAKMIGHFEIKKGAVTKANPSGFQETAVGKLAEGAMGSVIVVKMKDKNPYTNLVLHAYERDINLVVVDGEIKYGSVSYLNQAGLSGQYELLPTDSEDHSKVQILTESKPPLDGSAEDKLNFLTSLIKSFSHLKFEAKDKCRFDETKAIVFSQSVESDEDLTSFHKATGIHLDRVKDITKLLSINLMTQARNKLDPKEGKPEYALKYFPSLFSCNDENHQKRVSQFVRADAGDDEFTINRRQREELIKKYKLGRLPKSMAEKFRD